MGKIRIFSVVGCGLLDGRRIKQNGVFAMFVQSPRLIELVPGMDTPLSITRASGGTI